MKKQMISVGFLISYLWAYGQQTDNKGQLDMDPVAGGFVKEIKFVQKQAEGTYYFQDYWSVGKVILFNGSTLDDLQMRFDIEKNHLEIKMESQVKLLGDSYIKEFTLMNSESGNEMKFMNCSLYKENGVALVGFFESLVEGELNLFSKMKLNVIKANYDAKFDVGDKSDKIVKEENYFIGNGESVYRLTKNKKDNLKIFGEKSEAISSYLKSEKLSFKNRENITKIVAYYNSI